MNRAAKRAPAPRAVALLCGACAAWITCAPESRLVVGGASPSAAPDAGSAGAIAPPVGGAGARPAPADGGRSGAMPGPIGQGGGQGGMPDAGAGIDPGGGVAGSGGRSDVAGGGASGAASGAAGGGASGGASGAAGGRAGGGASGASGGAAGMGGGTPPPPPEVLDFIPDHGLPGDRVLIVGRQLGHASTVARAASGDPLAIVARGTTWWPDTTGQRFSVETLEITLPPSPTTGPLVVANAGGEVRGPIFTVGRNLARLPGTVVTASSASAESHWGTASAVDDDLRTSFFFDKNDCASSPVCSGAPFLRVAFGQPQVVNRVGLRGNREFEFGYNFSEVRVEIRDQADAVLWQEVAVLSGRRDLNLVLPAAVDAAASVTVFVLADESNSPGLAELQVF